MVLKEVKIRISPKSHKLLNQLLDENPILRTILDSPDFDDVLPKIKTWAEKKLSKNPDAVKYYHQESKGRKAFEKLQWNDFATIRVLDYVNHSGLELENLNKRGKKLVNDPFRLLWLGHHKGLGGAKPNFIVDMIELFRQFESESNPVLPTRKEIKEWMDAHPSGLDTGIIEIRKKNKDRIIKQFIEMMDAGEIKNSLFSFDPNDTFEDKYQKLTEWWENKLFHLKFAFRDPDLLNRMVSNTLGTETMDILYDAKEAGIPFFVNPYYLSLFDVEKSYTVGADLAIRDYVIFSKELIDEFGHIVAWEKEDIVEPGKPNAAGWLLPSDHNIHRRYPEVAILIPDSVGRACGGLCVSCQRMYDFQRGNLNFDLEKLKPTETWPKKLVRLLKYWQEDSQLRDILITGGDALMSSDKSLRRILDEIYNMALEKKKANKYLKNGEKHAEIVRIRLGTRLPVYLPQRINNELTDILADFKARASKIGIKQFVIQTHFESAMEVTPEAKDGIEKLSSAGWTIMNQQVFTTAASRRGHTAKLRRILNDIGVLTYYTFSVKGYMENYHNFATNARAVQEQIEEKRIGIIPQKFEDEIRSFPEEAENMVSNIENLRDEANIPFLATDKNVLNLPGVGKSLTYRAIGITRHGNRILEFDHDATRRHSPIINEMGKIIIIESKSIGAYLSQLEEMGEDIKEYNTIWGYSIGETEERQKISDYPDYSFKITEEMTNLELSE